MEAVAILNPSTKSGYGMPLASGKALKDQTQTVRRRSLQFLRSSNAHGCFLVKEASVRADASECHTVVDLRRCRGRILNEPIGN